MKVQCSKCQSKYNIKDEKIPDAGVKIKCPQCQNVISVMKPETQPLALSSEVLTPDLANESYKPDSKDEIKPETKKCPYCAEEINADALKCKHCGSDLTKSKAPISANGIGEKYGISMLICPLIAAFLIWIMPSYVPYEDYFGLPSFIIVMLAIFSTAILASIETSQLNMISQSSGKKETPFGIFLSIFLLWALCYPYYFYKRFKNGRKNFVTFGIIATVILLFSSGNAANYASTKIISYAINGFSNDSNKIFDPDILIVKNSSLQKYPQKTIGEAIDGFMGNPKWEAITATDGNPYVNARGKIMYGNKEATAALQFKIYRETNTFEINAFEINGNPANKLELWALMEKMYADSGNNGSGYGLSSSNNYSDKNACYEIETTAYNAAAAIADYFSDPDHTTLPTIEELENNHDFYTAYPIKLTTNDDWDTHIYVIDENNTCPYGKIYKFPMDGPGEWISSLDGIQ